MRFDFTSQQIEKNLRDTKRSMKYAHAGIAFFSFAFSLCLVSVAHTSLLFDFVFVCSAPIIGFGMGSLVIWLGEIALFVAKLFDLAEHPVPTGVIFSASPLSFISKILPVPLSPPRFCLADREAF